MKKIILFFAYCIAYQAATAQSIVSVYHLQTFTAAQIQAQYFIAAKNDVEAYYMAYQTVDVQGNPTVASGAIFVPVMACDSLPLVSYQHGTVLKKENVPSRLFEIGGLLIASQGYVTTAPDYLGLGDNAGLHPYLHSESEATASIDMMRAGREYITDSLNIILSGEVFLMGYSQGGHATMALHQYIEDHNLLTEFNVVASTPMSGPYNLSGVQSRISPDSLYASPGFLPYIIESYKMVYGITYTHPSEYYKPPYDTIIPQLFTGLIDINTLNDTLPNNIYHFMQDSVMDSFRADSIAGSFTHPLRIAMALNDNHNWLPSRPIRMPYCNADEQVYFENSIVAEDTMKALGATDVEAVQALAIGNHGFCILPAFSYALNWIDSLKTPCTPTTSIEALKTVSATIFPNPTQSYINISLPSDVMYQEVEAMVYDMAGRLIYSNFYYNQPTFQLDLNRYDNGIYIVTLKGKDWISREKVILLR